MRRVLRHIFFWGLLWCAAPALAETKLAFVVGIDTYEHLPPDAQLQRAVSDAEAVGDVLSRLGFQVTRVTQGGRLDTVLVEFERFTHIIRPGDTVVFYYAGHGISLNDGNYLIPADVPSLGPADERIAKRWSIAEREIKKDLHGAGARVAIVVIDACRNNPFPAQGTRAIGATSRGLARMDTADGVYSLYSAREGQLALDRLSNSDTDKNSVFTRVFLKELKTPGVSLSDLGEVVRDEVAALASGAGSEQVPAVSNDMIGARQVYLAGQAPTGDLGDLAAQSANSNALPTRRPAVMPDSASDLNAPDKVTWSFIQGTNDPKQIEAFLERFPQSAHRAEAEARLDTLKKRQVASIDPSTPPDKSVGKEPASDRRPDAARDLPVPGRCHGSPLNSDDPTCVPPTSFWEHNGSIVMLSVNGSHRKIVYQSPRLNVQGLGVRKGTLLFEGARSNRSISGTAYNFKRGCGPVAYDVSGEIADDMRTIVLRGSAPHRNEDCQVEWYREDRLVFSRRS